MVIDLPTNYSLYREKKIERTRGNSLQILFVVANLMSCSGCDLNFSRYFLLEGPSFILFLWRFQLLRLFLRLSIIIAMHLCRVLMATSRIISYQYVPHRGLDDFKMALNLEKSRSGRAHAEMTNVQCFKT